MRPSTARWPDLIRQSLDKSMKENSDSITFALSTISSSGGPTTRFVVHRGFVNERRPNDDPALSTNPINDTDGSPLINDYLMVTTDARAPKATQITSVSPKVSLAWWMLPTMTQFRIEATAYVLPPPGHPSLSSFPADRLSPGAEGAKFDWDSERIRVWRKMSPDLRASFVRPVPGTSLKGTEIKPESFPTSLPTDLEAKTDEEKRLIAIALSNIALIVLVPSRVDMVELGTKPHRRTIWELVDGEWSEEAVVP